MSNGVEYFLDFESSGLHPDSYPIEIGICGPGYEYDTLIKPVSRWTHWDYNAEDMHGLSRELIEEEGFEATSLCLLLNERFAGLVLWADSNLDAMWMAELFEASGIVPLFEVKNILSLIDQSKLPDYLEGLDDGVEHRALADAKALRQCWIAYQQQVSS